MLNNVKCPFYSTQLDSKEFEFISVKRNHVLKFRFLIDDLNLIAQKPPKVVNGRNDLKCPDLKYRKNP